MMLSLKPMDNESPKPHSTSDSFPASAGKIDDGNSALLAYSQTLTLFDESGNEIQTVVFDAAGNVDPPTPLV